jgi:Reverse transcriptase (RNA-dependent DNA polymerase)/Endonuclease-reverse transcriptase
MRVLCYNAQGLVAEADSILKFASTEQVDLAIVYETWLFDYDSPIFRNVIVNIAEPALSSLRGRRATGGIIIFCNNPQYKNEITVLENDPERHYSIIQVEETIIVAIYLPPSANNENLIQILDRSLEIAGGKDLVICGDLNARLGLFADDHASDQRGNLLLNYLYENPLYRQEPIEGKYTCFSNRIGSNGQLGRGIPEHVLTNGLIINNFRIFEEKPLGTSDHRPILFDVQVTEPSDKNFIRWNVRKFVDENIKQNYETLIEERKNDLLQIFATDININNCWNEFLKVIRECINIVCGKIHYNSKLHRDFWTTELANQRKEVLQATVELQQMANNQNIPLVIRNGAIKALTDRKRAYRERVLQRRKEIFEQMADNLSISQNYCTLMRYMKNAKARKDGGGCALDAKLINHHANHFRTTFGAIPEGVPTAIVDGVTPDDLKDPYRGWEPVAIPGVAAGHPQPGIGMPDFTTDATHGDYVAYPIELEVVKAELKGLPLGKAAGSDGIMAEMLVHGGEAMAELLTALLQKISNACRIPDDWRRALIVPVFKKKGDIKQIANYRPIALTCITRRLYERVLKRDVDRFTAQLADTQGGFRAFRSTLHQVYMLQEFQVKHPEMIKILMDMKAAYDMVDRRILWLKLRHHFNMPPSLIKRLRDLFDYNSSNLIIMGKESDDIINKRGLLQGSSLSPILFNFYINNLLENLQRNLPLIRVGNIALNHLAFADDLVLLGKNNVDLQNLLYNCDEWAKNQGMEFSPQKCVKITEEDNSLLFINDIELTVAKCNNYLGVAFDPNGINWNGHFAGRIKKAKSLISMMQTLGMNISGIAPAASVHLYKSFIRPVFEYGAALRILPANITEKLQRVQNQALRVILGGNRSTSINSLHKLLLMEKFETRNILLNMAFIGRLHNSRDRAIPAVRYWREELQNVQPTRVWKNSDSLTRVGRSNPLWTRANLISHLANPLRREVHKPDLAIDDQLKKKIKRKNIISLDHGHANIAGSIEVDEKERIRHVLKSAAFNGGRRKRITFSRWLIGAVANHQACFQCSQVGIAQELSREHALNCSGVIEDLEEKYSAHLGNYINSNLNKMDFLINKFRKKWPPNWHEHAVEWISRMLRLCRGFQQAGNGFWSPDSDGIG